MKKYSVYRTLSILFLLFLTVGANSQQLNIPLNQQFFNEYERHLLKSSISGHHSFKPLRVDQTHNRQELKDVGLQVLDLERHNSSYSLFRRKLMHEHLILIDTANVQISIDPILNLEIGQESGTLTSTNLYKNTRGFVVRSNIGKNFSFESSFRENQAILPQYIADRIESTKVAYGQGRVKKFKETAYDFSMSSAYVSFTPNKILNIRAGHGKHFIGDGQRSLLLSDLSFNYPYLRLQTSWFNDRLEYQNLYTSFQDLNRLPLANSSEALFERKRGSFHFLEYSVSENLNIGFFEGIIWPSLDSSGNIYVGANYWLPIIFVNTLIEGKSKKGNSLIGMNANMKFSSSILTYAQVALFDEELNQTDFQLGIKWFFHKNWMVQLEFNQSERDKVSNNYTQYNESLTQPLIGMDELISTVQFRKDRWISNFMANYAADNESEVLYADLNQSYLMNPSTNLTLSIGIQFRDQQFTSQSISGNNETVFLYVGLRTNLQNLYFNY